MFQPTMGIVIEMGSVKGKPYRASIWVLCLSLNKAHLCSFEICDDITDLLFLFQMKVITVRS